MGLATGFFLGATSFYLWYHSSSPRNVPLQTVAEPPSSFLASADADDSVQQPVMGLLVRTDLKLVILLWASKGSSEASVLTLC